MYEWFARHGVQYGPMARITTAFIFCGLAMAYSAGLQQWIYSAGLYAKDSAGCNGSGAVGNPSGISFWAQVPVYFLLAVAEIIGFATVFEYTQEKAPKNMKSIIQATAQLTACVACILGISLSPVAKDPYLVIIYTCLSRASGLSALLF